MVGKSCAARNKRVIPDPERQHVRVAQVARVRHVAGRWIRRPTECLLRDARHFKAVQQQDLRVEHVMALKQGAIPAWTMRPLRQYRAGRRRRVGAQIRVVVAMEINRRDVEILDVPHADQAVALQWLVSNRRSGYSRAIKRVLEVSWSLACVKKPAYALQPKISHLEGIASREIPSIPAVCRQTRRSFVLGEQRRGNAPPIIL